MARRNKPSWKARRDEASPVTPHTPDSGLADPRLPKQRRTMRATRHLHKGGFARLPPQPKSRRQCLSPAERPRMEERQSTDGTVSRSHDGPTARGEPEHRPTPLSEPPKRHDRTVRTKVSGTPSRGSVPFSENRCANRCVSACLTDTFRSQGFSPSQRFEPHAPLRLCFTPHPLIGFVTFRAFPTGASGCTLRYTILSCH
jgi:hypothetical protein